MKSNTANEARADACDDVANQLVLMLKAQTVRPEWLPIVRAKASALRADAARLRTMENECDRGQDQLATKRA